MDTTAESIAVTIAVLTFRRPDVLACTLPTMLEHGRAAAPGPVATGGAAQEPRFKVRILVVDNDPAGSARATVRSLGAADVSYYIESNPGISAARNRALDEARSSDLLVFIDDDEQPREGWLDTLLQTWSRTGAGLVCGKVAAEFDGVLDPWVAAGEFFDRFSMPTGTVIHVAAAGNVLLDLRQVRPLGVRFESRFGLSGGEDNLFSRMLDQRGLPMVWCEESVATDRVPAVRMTRKWVLTRAFSHGNTAGLVEIELTDGPTERWTVRAWTMVSGLLRLAAGSARFLLGLVARSNRHQARGLRTVCWGAGMVTGAAGLVYQEYARSGPRLRLRRSLESVQASA